MPGSRPSLIVSVLTFFACLIAIAWIVISLSDMQNASKEICSKEGKRGLALSSTFISQLPDEIPSYPKGVLPASSPSALFAQTLVDKGDIYRLTLLDRNERSIFSAGRSSAGVYSPFPKEQPDFKEGFLLDNMAGVALVVPIDRNGATLATVGIVLPISAEMGRFYIFHKSYPLLIVFVAILLLASGSALLTKALNKPVNPLFAMFLSLKSRLPELSRHASNQNETGGLDEPVKIIIKPLQKNQYPETRLAEEAEKPPAHQELNIAAATDKPNAPILTEPPLSGLTATTGLLPDFSPQLSSLFEDAFADLATQRDVANIDFYRSCREKMPAIGIGSDELKQVLTSLMLNAHDTMPEGGQLVVRAKLEGYDDGAASEEHLVRIDILDSGTGLSGKQQAKIFDPSYKPRSLPKEMVPRLAYARNVIERSGGRIGVKSQVGKGSCFTVWLPV